MFIKWIFLLIFLWVGMALFVYSVYTIQEDAFVSRFPILSFFIYLILGPISLITYILLGYLIKINKLKKKFF